MFMEVPMQRPDDTAIAAELSTWVIEREGNSICYSSVSPSTLKGAACSLATYLFATNVFTAEIRSLFINTRFRPRSQYRIPFLFTLVCAPLPLNSPCGQCVRSGRRGISSHPVFRGVAPLITRFLFRLDSSKSSIHFIWSPCFPPCTSSLKREDLSWSLGSLRCPFLFHGWYYALKSDSFLPS